MTKQVYIVARSYAPNTAATNRLLAYLKRFVEKGIRVTMVFFFPDENGNKYLSIPNGVNVIYYWEKKYSANKYFQLIYNYLNVRSFVKSLPAGANVLVYGAVDVVHELVKRNDIHVFHERTEHPGVIGYKKVPFLPSLKQYLRDCQKCDSLFVISTCLKEYFIEHGVSKDRVVIINMIVDPSRYDGIERKPSERYLAYCGVIYNNKDGVDDLIKAFAKVSPSHPDVKLYILGRIMTGEDIESNMKLIEVFQLKDKIKLCGEVQADDMPQILKNAEVLVLARPDGLRARAGFPTKLGEYLISSNPVVVTAVGDIPLFLKDHESALLATPGDLDEFADKVNWCLDNVKQAQVIGERGAYVAMKEFNYQYETDKIVNRLSL